MSVGVVLLVVGVIFAGLTLFHTFSARAGARALKQTSAPVCPDLVVDVKSPDLMSVTASGTLKATVKNRAASACDLQISVSAAAPLDVQPKQDKTTRLSSGQTDVSSWILTATKSGTWDISVIVDNVAYDRRIVVTNILGFSAVTASVLSLVGPALGAFVGGLGLLDRWKQRASRAGR